MMASSMKWLFVRLDDEFVDNPVGCESARLGIAPRVVFPFVVTCIVGRHAHVEYDDRLGHGVVHVVGADGHGVEFPVRVELEQAHCCDGPVYFKRGSGVVAQFFVWPGPNGPPKVAVVLAKEVFTGYIGYRFGPAVVSVIFGGLDELFHDVFGALLGYYGISARKKLLSAKRRSLYQSGRWSIFSPRRMSVPDLRLCML